MHNPAALLLILYITGVLLLGWFNAPARYAVPTAILRILAGLFVLIIVVEPKFTFSELVRQKTRPMLLIDRSESMNDFGLDTIITLLEKYHYSSDEIWFFGDSLRKGNLSENRSLDSRSVFPDMNLIPPPDHPLILITDGAVSFAPDNVADTRRLYYLPLDRTGKRPFIEIHPPEQLRLASDKNSPFMIPFQTFCRMQDTLTVTVDYGKIRVGTFKKPLSPGLIINDTIGITIPPQPAGRNLITMYARTGETVNGRKRESIGISFPAPLKLSLVSKTKTLDERFLRHWFSQSETFEIGDHKKPDILIQFGSVNYSKPRPQTPVTVTIGENSPSPRSLIIPSSEIVLRFPSYLTNKTYAVAPPDAIIPRSEPLAGIITHAMYIDPQNISIPLVYSYSDSRGRLISVDATGTWKWDFNRVSDASPFPEGGFYPLLSTIIQEEYSAALSTDPLVLLDYELLDKTGTAELTVFHPTSHAGWDSISSSISITSPKGDTIQTFPRIRFNRHRQHETVTVVPKNIDDPENTLTIDLQYNTSRFSVRKTITETTRNTEENGEDQNRLLLESMGATRLDYRELQVLLQDTTAQTSVEKKSFRFNGNPLFLILTLLLSGAAWYLDSEGKRIRSIRINRKETH